MSGRPCKIAIAGTHSTGKTTFMRRLQDELVRRGLRPAYVHDSAVNARELGFPILRDHTFESTAWIMAEAIRLETVASLTADVILVDRPVPDALGYLSAALRVTHRVLPPGRLERLEAICAAWVGEYDMMLVTELDPAVPIGPGRDDDNLFRAAAAEEIAAIMGRLAPDAMVVRSTDAEEALRCAIAVAKRDRASA
ncbi:AAA family ATPase [Sphingomonas sp.]|uniref:AAA family ATPase n=1 Tax=Sphingomonas sp. TaxID=28214 RepID=UPI0035BC85A7